MHCGNIDLGIGLPVSFYIFSKLHLACLFRLYICLSTIGSISIHTLGGTLGCLCSCKSDFIHPHVGAPARPELPPCCPSILSDL
jgi:hypothetical protein